MNKSLYDSLKLLIHFWKLSSEPWGAKDNQSKFIYANDKYKALLALPNKFCVRDDLTENSQRLLLNFKQIFNNMTAKSSYCKTV